MATSDTKAVPPGKMRCSAVGRCVPGPPTSLARPSQQRHSACFGDVDQLAGSHTPELHEIELPALDQHRQTLESRITPAATDDVSNEQDSHAVYSLRKSMTSRSVSMRSRGASRDVTGTDSTSCTAKAIPIALMV